MTSASFVGSTFFGIDLRKVSERLQGMRRQVSKRVLLIEFDRSSLRLGEARFLGGGLQVDHLTRFELPEDALERGVPRDPVKMGGLIKQLCREKQISVHRSAVVLPTEVAFQRLIDLPVELLADQARDYLLDPMNGLQIPIALTQADFDLQPTFLPVLQSGDQRMQAYLLTAIPSNLLDRVMETLQVAELELQALEIGGISQLRLIAADLLSLKESEVRLVLELNTDCTHFSLVSSAGPLCFERLAAIREFPDPVLTPEQTISALEEGVIAEQICINQESYLAIGNLDLRVLFSEVSDALKRFSSNRSGFRLVDIILTGRNSAHPFLPALLKEEFDCPVRTLEPSLSVGIEGLQFDNILVQKSINRLLGLGLGLLPSDYLLIGHDSEVSGKTVFTEAIPLVDVTPGLVSAPRDQQTNEHKSFDVTKEEVEASLLSNPTLDSVVEAGQEPAVSQTTMNDSPADVQEQWPNVNVSSFVQSASSEPSQASPDPALVRSESLETDSVEWPTIHDSDLDAREESLSLDQCSEQDDASTSDQTSDGLASSSMGPLNLSHQHLTSIESSEKIVRGSMDVQNPSQLEHDRQWLSIGDIGMSDDFLQETQSVNSPAGPLPSDKEESSVLPDHQKDESEDNLLGELKFSDEA